MNRTRFALIQRARQRARRHSGVLSMLAVSAALLALPGIAQAGLPDIAGKANTFATWIGSAGLAVLTGAISYTGYKTLARGVQFEQVEKIFWGGVFLGTAALIAAFAIS